MIPQSFGVNIPPIKYPAGKVNNYGPRPDSTLQLQELYGCNDYKEVCRFMQEYLYCKGWGDVCPPIGSRDTYFWLISIPSVRKLFEILGLKPYGIDALMGNGIILPVVLGHNHFLDIHMLIRAIYNASSSGSKEFIGGSPTEARPQNLPVLQRKLVELFERVDIEVGSQVGEG